MKAMAAIKSALPKKLKLYYDSVNKTWCIQANRATKINGVYWGATYAPLQAIHSAQLTSRVPQTQLYSCISGYQTRTRNVYAGPLIGILAAKGSTLPFSGNWRNFIDLMRMGQKRGGIVYVFTPEEINWQEERIKGWVYQPDVKRWRSLIFPFPNVVYNRISSRKQENSPEVRETLHRLRGWRDRVSLFNPHFFNKQEIFRILGDSEELAPFLPDTQPLTSKQDLAQMLEKHSSLYLKPTKGWAGRGIQKISRVSRSNAQEQGKVEMQREGENPTYLFTVQEAKQVKQKRTSSIAKLWKLFQAHKISFPYIIQQGIESARLEGRPFDFRVLVQKNKTGKWEVTGIGSRVAGQHRITTHVPRGGRIASSSYVLEQIYPDQAEQFLERIKQLALSCAQELERAYGELGEMSMDIGLDQHGKLWFFEANSKPMKFDEPSIRAKSLINIIDYSKHLTFSR